MKALSLREAEAFFLICRGLERKQIAAEMGVSVARVKDMRRSILLKTGAASALQLVAMAIESGLA